MQTMHKNCYPNDFSSKLFSELWTKFNPNPRSVAIWQHNFFQVLIRFASSPYSLAQFFLKQILDA